MAYIFKQKLQIYDLVDMETRPKKVLIHEPEEYLARLYEHYLKQGDFKVKNCQHLGRVREIATEFVPDILVFNIEFLRTEKAAADWLRNFKKDFPGVGVVTIGLSASSEILKTLMSIGVSGHINRSLTRPRDLVIVVKNVLQV